MISIASAYSPLTGGLNPVPRIASTYKSARDNVTDALAFQFVTGADHDGRCRQLLVHRSGIASQFRRISQQHDLNRFARF